MWLVTDQTARDVLAAVFKRAEDDAYLHGAWNSKPTVTPDDILDALRAARVAVIPLPEPTDGPDKTGHVRFSDGSEVGTVTTDVGSGVVWADGWEWDVNQARDVAAVWLAAAAAAEEQQ